MVSGVPKPQRSATAAMVSSVLSEHLAGGFDPHLLDVVGRRRAALLAEGTGERALAHAGVACQGGHRAVVVEVLADPRLQLAQRGPLGGLGGEWRAELVLAAGALEVHHQPAGHEAGDSRAEVVLDEGEGEVDARR